MLECFGAMDIGSDNPNPPARSHIERGDAVWVIEKEEYGTGNYTQGFVDQILTSREFHPRGIKVRLTDGTIGRVQWIIRGDSFLP